MSFSLAGLTGLLDGFIAQYWDNQKSAFVHLLIKIPICTTYISLTYADLIPAPLTSVIVSKDAMLTAVIFMSDIELFQN